MARPTPKTINSSQAGFSLVELAIVLIIIGLLVGGILKGQELIESARLKAVLSQLNEYRVATGTFMDLYDALPGDFDKAHEPIDPGLINVKNNRIISGNGLNPREPALQYWAHLAAAKLISAPGKPPDGGNAKFGHGAPAARIGGGITVCYNPKSDMPGHWYLLGAENGDKGDGAILTPQQAMSLDNQADNGDPNSGGIRATKGVNAKAECITNDGLYNTKSSNERACILYFKF